MALTFQYNKTFLQQLGKGLKIRMGALPILAAKEAALRLEVKKAREAAAQTRKLLDDEYASISATFRFWNEFPRRLVSIRSVTIDNAKIAGVKIPVLRDIQFSIERHSTVMQPAWVPSGIEALKRIVRLNMEIELARKRVDILEYARRKTTQKVNLYEKVQIPEYREAIRKIKRFMEDEDNLSKASQKVLKARNSLQEAAL